MLSEGDGILSDFCVAIHPFPRSSVNILAQIIAQTSVGLPWWSLSIKNTAFVVLLLVLCYLSGYSPVQGPFPLILWYLIFWSSDKGLDKAEFGNLNKQRLSGEEVCLTRVKRLFVQPAVPCPEFVLFSSGVSIAAGSWLPPCRHFVPLAFCLPRKLLMELALAENCCVM